MPLTKTYLGTILAILATIIWSGNFIVARGVADKIGPVSLAFFRWLAASLIIAPIAWKRFTAEKAMIKAHFKYLFWAALIGISLFNTLVYIAGHYTTAINLALIGSTSSPMFATIMAVLFLKEKLGIVRITGFVFCLAGILLLLSKGSWETLAAFRFSKGDLWIITAALAFAVYSILVKKKPESISSVNFLFVVFAAGTIMLLPAYIWELQTAKPVEWNPNLVYIILYLGAGASVIAFLCWNTAIRTIGAARTVLFGNLIPIFSVWEAVIFLGEKVTRIHVISGVLVIAGLFIANTRLRK